MIVAGAGLTGATCARILAEQGHEVIVYEPGLIGGLCADTPGGSVFGPHIFHTDDEEVWAFVTRFADFDGYRHEAVALTDVGPVPWPPNDETRAICGEYLFDLCIRDYSYKMWGYIPDEDVLERITSNEGDDRSFFPDRFQGRPIGGYTQLISNLLQHRNITLRHRVAPWVVAEGIWTAPLPVPYRQVEFIDIPGGGEFRVLNICTAYMPFTRMTIYPEWTQLELPGRGVPCYPLDEHREDAEQAKEEMRKRGWVCAGRMGGYEYLDMDDAVRGAMDLCSP